MTRHEAVCVIAAFDTHAMCAIDHLRVIIFMTYFIYHVVFYYIVLNNQARQGNST
jgi:hypothetical protein